MILVSEGFIYDPNLDEFKDVVQAARGARTWPSTSWTPAASRACPSDNTAEFGPALDTQDIGAAFTENLEASEGAESHGLGQRAASA